MPLDSKLFGQPATRGQVAEVSLSARSVALALKRSILAQRNGNSAQLDQSLASVDKAIEDMADQFNELVGWTSA